MVLTGYLQISAISIADWISGASNPAPGWNRGGLPGRALPRRGFRDKRQQ